MITKITYTKLFFPVVYAMLFVCTCFYCSCYTTDIIKPEPDRISEIPPDDIKAIALKNGKKVSTEEKQIRLIYDSQLKNFAMGYNISKDTVKLNEYNSKIVNKLKTIPLDSIQYIEFHKLNAGLTALAIVGAVITAAIIVFMIVASQSVWQNGFLGGH